MIENHITGFQRELQDLISQPGDHGESDMTHMLTLHARHMSRFYKELQGADRFMSHATCYCCLTAAPEHALPCGHVLCTGCVKSYGKKRGSRSLLEMTYCPLHERETRWSSPCQLRFKPDYAGVRLLCLDGYVNFQLVFCFVGLTLQSQWWHPGHSRARGLASHPKISWTPDSNPGILRFDYWHKVPI
jgi:hypothetical protein